MAVVPEPDPDAPPLPPPPGGSTVFFQSLYLRVVLRRSCAHGFSEFGGQDGQETTERVGHDLLAVGQGGQVVHRTPPQLRKLLNIVAMALGSPRQEWQNAETTSRLAVVPTAAT